MNKTALIISVLLGVGLSSPIVRHQVYILNTFGILGVIESLCKYFIYDITIIIIICIGIYYFIKYINNGGFTNAKK